MALLALAACSGGGGTASQSVARQWDEEALAAIRIDLPRPPVHARNLYYLSVAMWDAWAAYEPRAQPVLAHEMLPWSRALEQDRAVAVSYAAYRVLSHVYSLSVNAATTQAQLDARMQALKLDKDDTGQTGNAPAAVGNRIAATILAIARNDGANEDGNYQDPSYQPINDPLIVKQPGTTMADANRWQPLALDFQVSQNGIPIPGKVQVFAGSHWGDVKPFALIRSDPGAVYLDPGPPPQLGGVGDEEFKVGVVELIEFSRQLDASNLSSLDISPAAVGNNSLGSNDGHGYLLNPVTGGAYPPQIVRRADFQRVLAEFWADGPQSETPPGHWNALANYVSDQPSLVKRIAGRGSAVSALEWDVKMYLALNGALHDAAVECWGVKRKYDSVRPISQIRYMGALGQSSDAAAPSYHPSGLPLVPGLIELITTASSVPGERHSALADYVGEIALLAWPGEPADPTTQASPARWIRAKNWLPYQRKTFVTPPFAAYFSGHSAFSRAAAEVLTRLTGSPYFPGGLGEYRVLANRFLKFEVGPSADLRLQWASYYDAADQAGLSRLYGGIHPRVDDYTGRRMGAEVGIKAWTLASQHFNDSASP